MSKNLISLKVKCPHCDHSLMDYTHFLNAKPSIKLHIHVKDQEGEINLCSTYGCYDKISTIDLPENEIVRLSCHHCKQELPVSAICDVCKAPLVYLNLEKGGKVHACSRIGCDKHAVSFEDIYSTLSNFYNEFEYGAEDRDF